MTGKTFWIILIVTAMTSTVVYFLTRTHTTGMLLTGIVSTDEVVVSSQVQGQIERMLVKEGDSVPAGGLLAVIEPRELRADQSYYAHAEQSTAAQVREARAALEYQRLETRDEIRRQEAALAAAEASEKQAEAGLERARLDYQRAHQLYKQGIASAQADDQARTAYQGQKAQVTALEKQAAAQRAAVSLAKAAAEQIAIRESELAAGRSQLRAVAAQKEKAQVRLSYTELHSPIAGLVAVRAALAGEVVMPGQPVVVLYDPDDLWVRVDVEESYIGQIRLGDRFPVRFPGGLERTGTVFFRGVDAEYATARDVSRTKRDIKTFKIRLRVDNKDRRLAPGLTAYVTVPLKGGI